MHKVQSVTSCGHATSKVFQGNRPKTNCQTRTVTNYSHHQFNQSGSGGQTKIPSPVSPKSSNAGPRQNLWKIITIPQTLQAPEFCAHMEHILRQ